MSWIGRTLLGALASVLSLAAPTAQAQELQGVSGPAPKVLWAIPVGETDAARDEIDGVAVDPSGNTTITGIFRDEVRLGGRTYRSRGDGDIFLASYAPDGELRWTRQIGGTGDDNAYDITNDDAGNLFVSGWYSNRVDFGGVTLSSRGGTDMFVAKYAPDGRLLWARSFGGRRGDGGNEIAALPSGEVAVSAITEGDFTVDDDIYRFGGGRRDSLVLRLSPSGDVRWVTAINGPGIERIRAIDIGTTGDVYVGFQYRDSVRSQGVEVRGSGEDWDGALMRLYPDGRVAWARGVGGGDGTDNVRGLGVGPDGSVYISGVIRGKTTFLGRELPEIGQADYVARVTPEGRTTWLLGMIGGGMLAGSELIVDPRGVIVSGTISGTVQLRLGRERIGSISAPGGSVSGYLVALTPEGRLRFAFVPTPEGRGAAAKGAPLAVSRDGRYLAQAIRFRNRVGIGGNVLTRRPGAEADSGLILFDLNGA